eukprot:TRINITY_DN4677_c0_g1_i1.p1 TRINITY_DN4677_c0_g1~~TRINITY_DN4677_c0_g1_i1.p1  ORF type:complete len:368 (+),score=93.65 TRINITY_DN4677_c0_g1_i1:311-1414(+)
MGQNESISAREQTNSKNGSKQQQPRSNQQPTQSTTAASSSSSNSKGSTNPLASSAISSNTRLPNGALSLIKESPSPSPPTFLATIARQNSEEDFSHLSTDRFSGDWSSSTQTSSNYKRASFGSNSRTKHLVFEDGIEVSFEDNESPPPLPKLTPITTSSQLRPLKSEMSATQAQSASTDSSSPQSDVIEDGCYVHMVKKNDTLQGIALTYRVKVEDIKTKNKLWSKNDLFARKKLLIPLSAQLPLSASTTTTSSLTASTSDLNSSQSAAISRSGEALSSEDSDRNIVTTKFMRDLKTSVEIAIHYLERSNWNYSEAVDNYIDDIRNSVIVAPAPRENKKKKPLGEVAKLRTSQQNAFNQLEDDIYEL